MPNTGTLQVTTPTEREIVMNRVFNAPRRLVFDALTKPELGTEMGMGGVFREIAPPERLVATEAFDESWYPGEALDTTVLVEQGGRTTLTLTVLYESRAARDAVLQSDMERGVNASYDRLAELLVSTPAPENR